MERKGIPFACREQRIYHVLKKGTFYGIQYLDEIEFEV